MEQQALTPAMEDYLEAILQLEEVEKEVRVKDIARRLGVSLPSVTGMLRSLSERDLIAHRRRYEHVVLTPEGRRRAREVRRRHETLRDFLVQILQLDPALAEREACRMEHAIGQDTLERLVEFLEFVEVCPRAGRGWREYFRRFCAEGRRDCRKCMEEFIREWRRKMAGRTLKDLSPGRGGKVVRVGGSGALRRRLLDMGLVPGAVVEVERVAPLGDPLEVKVKGYHLSLRGEEAALVEVEEL